MATTQQPTPTLDPKDLPNAKAPWVERMQARWKRCRDLVEGTDAIHKAGPTYLPRHPAEEPEDYRRRSTGTELYNGFSRTVTAMTGLVYQREPQLGDDVPSVVQGHWENIDGRGTHGAVFAKRLFSDGLTTGLAGILVEYPKVADPESVSVATEAALKLRPYWVAVTAEQFTSARFTKVGGVVVLSQFVLREETEEPSGTFGTVCVIRYRVFRRVEDEAGARISWELWQEKAESGIKRFERVEAGELRNVKRIPFAPFLAGPVQGDLETKPPLLDLADVNLAHYRVSADRRHVMHLVCVPIPVRKGYVPPAQGEVKPFGPNLMIDVPADGGFEWVAPPGTAFEPTGKELETLERRMASLGMAFLMSETRGAETAEAKRIDSAAQNASLATAAHAEQDCLEAALSFHAEYLGVAQEVNGEISGGSIAVNKEFERIVADPAMIAALSALETAGQLSLETLLDLLETWSVLPTGFDVQAEVARILRGRIDSTPASTPPPAGDTEPDDGADEIDESTA